jgi:CheY-like chemotaxis protein
MAEPLALVLYTRLLPGSQLVNRLQDLKYRVQTLAEPSLLVQTAQESKPMVVLADLDAGSGNVCEAVARLKQDPSTRHLPVIAFGAENAPELQAAAQAAGVALIVGEVALVNHLTQILDQALQVD